MTDSEDDFDWAALAEEFRRNNRPHAGHFSWETDRDLAEYGVLTEFTAALARTDRLFFRDATHRGKDNDPPDCEAVGIDGRRIGIEITELVDGRSAAAARAGEPYDHKDWEGELVPHLERILRRKDSPTELKDPPYGGYILVIFSDEPALGGHYVSECLKHHVFHPTHLISRAFVLMSYDPFQNGYPCCEMLLTGDA